MTRTNVNHTPATAHQAAVDFVATMTDAKRGTTACDLTPRASAGRLVPDGGWSQPDIDGLVVAFMPHIYPFPGDAGAGLSEWLIASCGRANLPVVLEESGNLLGATSEEVIEI